MPETRVRAAHWSHASIGLITTIPIDLAVIWKNLGVSEPEYVEKVPGAEARLTASSHVGGKGASWTLISVQLSRSSPEGGIVATKWPAAIQAALPPEGADLACFGFVHLRYPAESSKWRLPLLQGTPVSLGESDTSLGKVKLSGVKLSCEDSPIGVTEVAVEYGDDGALEVEPNISMQARSSDLAGIPSKIVETAESVGSYFVDVNAPSKEP